MKILSKNAKNDVNAIRFASIPPTAPNMFIAPDDNASNKLFASLEKCYFIFENIIIKVLKRHLYTS